MEHLTEVLKIVNGGLRKDSEKVSKYAELLASKLESEGEAQAAEMLRRTLSKLQPNSLRAMRLAEKLLPPVDSESRVAIADVSYLSLEDVPLVLSGVAKELLDSAIECYRSSEEFARRGVPGPGHILFFGPPGCGKTQAAKYVAAALRLPLVTARIDGVISSFLGSTAKNIRALFEFVDEAPCVLLLDEFDALAKMRDDPHELGELKRVVNSLLQNIDLLPTGTVVIAATNHDHLLDSAVWRRFEYHIPIDPPDDEARQALFSIYLPVSFRTSHDEVRVLEALTHGFSAAEIKGLCDALARRLVLERRKELNIRDAADLIWTRRTVHSNGERSAEKAVEDRIRELRSLDAKLFTYGVMSRLLGVSTGKISNVLREPRTDG